MTAQLRHENVCLERFYDEKGHYCEVWGCDDEDVYDFDFADYFKGFEIKS